MTTYLIVEHDNKQIKSSTFNTLAAALKLQQRVVAIVAGYQCDGVAESIASIKGVDKVLVADHETYLHPLAERFCPLILSATEDAKYILMPATTFGKNLLPRIAAKRGVALISDVIEIKDAETFKHPIYAGNAIETVKSHDALICLTIRTTAFPPLTETQVEVEIEALDFVSDNHQSKFISQELHNTDRPELSSAKIVISGGRGLKDQAGFSRMIKIAERLGAAVGASRAAVDSEMAPNDTQVGQTGQVVAPQLYIALGISGAIQHLAGMKDSKVIVAINKDPDAPIFQVADYGIVADLNEFIPEWENVLTEMGY